MDRSPAIRRYHELTVALIVVLAVSIGLSAAIVPAWLGITFTALSAALRVKPHSTPVLRGIAIMVGLIAFALSLYVGVATYQETQDIVFFFGPFFNACLAISLIFQNSKALDWKICVSTLMLSVTGVIGGGEVLDHILFIFFCGAFVFYLNATYFIESEPNERLPQGYFRPFVLCLLAGWSFGIFIFVFFPRTIQWSNPFGLRDRQTLTGYSGSLSLTGSGPTPSSAIALVVEPMDRADQSWIAINGPDLYFRGNTLDQFDGEKWHQTLLAAEPLQGISHNRAQSTIHGIKIYREPHSTQWIVYPGILWNIELPNKTTGRTLIDESGNLLRSITGYLRYSYTADFEESSLFYWGRTPHLSSRERATYLALPLEFEQKGFFQNWLGSLSSSPKETPLADRLQLLGHHFQSQFKAVLGEKLLTLESFLSKEKKGHCEFFATAATLALRSWGHPARVVLGYRGGQFNRLSQVLEVRDENAHSWVEVFVENRGWLRFDPTPLVRRLPSFAWVEEWQLWIGAGKYWFSRYVVDYNSRTQTELLLKIGNSNDLSWKSLGIKLTGKIWWIGSAFLILCLFLIRKRLIQRTKTRELGLPRYYLDFQKKLRKLGFVRTPQESFKIFHQRVHHTQIPPEDLHTIDLKLERELYAANHPL